MLIDTLLVSSWTGIESHIHLNFRDWFFSTHKYYFTDQKLEASLSVSYLTQQQPFPGHRAYSVDGDLICFDSPIDCKCTGAGDW